MLDTGAVHDPLAIRSAAAALAQSERLYPRDIAERLRISEAELIASAIGDPAGPRTVRLVDDLATVLRKVPSLGSVMALTRNDAAVHEKHGPYRDVKLFDGTGGVFERSIDLRLFMSHWQIGFAVDDHRDGRLKRSLQFFDADGSAVHKVHLQEHSDHGRFERLVEDCAHHDQSPAIRVAMPAAPPGERPDAEIDRQALRDRWLSLADVHQFHGLLKDLGVGRQQSFRLIGGEFARPVHAESLRLAGEAAAETGLSVMIFVPNPGCIQIHTGPIRNLKTVGAWWNILDPGFNLHLRQDLVATAWVVRKPTRFGIVTSLELFDREQRLVAMMFGERAPEAEETEGWRRIAAGLQATT